MKIALIGYGKMGKTIEQIALGRGHQIVSVVDINNPEEIHSDNFKSADVAIEFQQLYAMFCGGCSGRFRYDRLARQDRAGQGNVRKRGENFLLRIQLQHRCKHILRPQQILGKDYE